MTAPQALTVAVQGELGSNSELAAREYFTRGDVTIVSCRTFAALFDAVHGGTAEFGMAPIDNSMGGSIHEVWELLVDAPLPIEGEIYLRISHCLISHRGTRLADIRRIYSHPQALVQCSEYLRSQQDVEVEEVYDTAGAVKMIAESGEKNTAAIASAQAAADYNMEVLASDLQIRRDNFTRFLILSPTEQEHKGDLKTTTIAALDNTAPHLPDLLTPLTDRRIEILKSELHPSRDRPWKHLLYLELDGSPRDPEISAALTQMRTKTKELWTLGSYPKGRHAEPRIHTR
jgi:prephenate dehydratase